MSFSYLHLSWERSILSIPTEEKSLHFNLNPALSVTALRHNLRTLLKARGHKRIRTRVNGNRIDYTYDGISDWSYFYITMQNGMWSFDRNRNSSF